jgi:hypothetical protein
MRLMCEERDRLWTEYDKALKEYIFEVEQMTQLAPYDGVAAKEALGILLERPTAVGTHCIQHRYDPDFFT